jgi:hypothetical protein
MPTTHHEEELLSSKTQRFVRSKLGLGQALDQDTYQNILESVMTCPALHAAIAEPAYKRAIAAHMFLVAHKHRRLLAYFTSNEALLDRIASEIDQSEFIARSCASKRAARKYANYLRLRGLLLLPPKQQRARETLARCCQFMLDCEDGDHFVVKRVGMVSSMRRFFCADVAPAVEGDPSAAKLVAALKAALRCTGEPRAAALRHVLASCLQK